MEILMTKTVSGTEEGEYLPKLFINGKVYTVGENLGNTFKSIGVCEEIEKTKKVQTTKVIEQEYETKVITPKSEKKESKTNKKGKGK